jgi:putative SOS response-associated peptidase YedK
VCNEYGNRIPYQRYIEEFSHLKLPLSVQGNGPDLTSREEIHIRDTAPVIVAAAEGVELTQRVWAPRGPNKKPVFNFRSEKRSFAKSLRCLIPATHFVEFTAPADPKQKRKDKWRFTLAGAQWFCIAGIVLHHADHATRSGRCALSRPPGGGAAPARLVGVAQPEPAGSGVAAPARARCARGQTAAGAVTADRRTTP